MNTKRMILFTFLIFCAVIGSLAFYFLDATGSKPNQNKVVLKREPQNETSDPSIPSLSDFFVDDSGYDAAYSFSTPITNRSDLNECYHSAVDRYHNGVRQIQSQIEQLKTSGNTPAVQTQRARLQLIRGLLDMYIGNFDEATLWFQKAGEENPAIPREFRANLTGLCGVAALRKGELANCVACVGPSSCIYPIASDAVHQFPEGSTAALKYFREYQKQWPQDIGVQWLIHIAESTLGHHSESGLKFKSEWNPIERTTKQFENLLQETGLGIRGPNMLGGAIWDDFNGDDRPDLFIGSGDWTFGASMFIQNLDKTYSDIGEKSELNQQRMAANSVSADFDNDGDLDVLMLRGGWESPYRMTLLINKGDGQFEDNTIAAGLGDPIASQSAAWSDFDLDGDLDLYVAGEYHDRNATRLNCNRLYENKGDGTFQDIAEKAGVLNQGWAKGVVWGDYNNDGKPDIFVSNMNSFNRLYHNNGDGTFTDKAAELNLIEPVKSFSCWFWDFDDDGLLDIFVAGFSASLNAIVAGMTGGEIDRTTEKPRLYRNLGEKGFENVTEKAGLNFVTVPMGSNFADYDNDGRLDFYLATGRPSYSMLMPNRMFRNLDGLHFQDTTVATATGHLQKGHGVSFADHDMDGDLDLFVQTGGQTPADQSHNVLFQNPGFGQNSIQIRLVGTKSNRSAIGSKVVAIFRPKDGKTRTIHREVSSGSSFGGNSLTVHLGLADAELADQIEIQWPITGRQVFTGIKSGQLIEIKEGDKNYRVISTYTSSDK